MLPTIASVASAILFALVSGDFLLFFHFQRETNAGGEVLPSVCVCYLRAFYRPSLPHS